MGKFLILLLSLTTALPGFANPNNGKVQEYMLNNGLKIIVKEDHRAPVVISQIWYKVGSSYEPNGLTGISHVLEHMMFKGTQQYGPGEFSKMVAANGGEENAFTTEDFTAYYQKLSADKLELSFMLESDRMKNLLLDPKEFNKEIKVVREERRLRTDNDPQALTYERFNATAYISSPYHHPVVGWMDDLLNLKISDVSDWYRTWYAPNNAILVVVGDVDPQQVLASAEKYFGKIPPSPLTTLKPRRELSSPGKREISVKAPAKLPLLMMGFNTPSLTTAKQPEDAYALEVLAAILDGSNSARLESQLVRGKQIAAGTDINYDLYHRQSGLLMIVGVPAEQHSVAELQDAINQQIQRLQQERITQEELDRVKAQVIANKVFSLDSLFYQGTQIGTVETIGLTWQDMENYADNIKAVTPKQVQQVATRYLVTDNLTIAVLQPTEIHEQTQPVVANNQDDNHDQK